MVIIDQDAFGPAGSNLQAILLLLQASDVEVLGITVARCTPHPGARCAGRRHGGGHAPGVVFNGIRCATVLNSAQSLSH
jgi:hypothetical protein